MESDRNDRFSILVCIDGTEESYRGLHYAIKFGLDHADTDISLLYIRSLGSSERAAHAQMSRDDDDETRIDNWDLDEAALKALNRARDMLVESGFLGSDWAAEDVTKKVRRVTAGDHQVKYTSSNTGQSITLIVREASSVLTGILNEAHFYRYDIVIVSASKSGAGGDNYVDTYTAIGVATEHDGTVILVRELEEGHGHFVCVNDSDASMEMVRKDAMMAQRCGCSIHLYAVASDEKGLPAAHHALERAEQVVEATGARVSEKRAEVGEPIWRIVDRGRAHSLIVLSATEKSTLKQLFMGSVSHTVLKKARNSVMIVR
jgi:nucleotide-binding universal stress UspA family protein